MEQTTQPAKPKSGAVYIAITLTLALVMGVAGYFGATYFMDGRNPAGGNENVLRSGSGVPTDEYGDNLFGNHAFNLQNGGFFAAQGGNTFFVNFADGGSLYCEKDDGEIVKFTDFPVANLGVVGNRLVFTDLQYCVFLDTAGDLRYVGADSHEDVWDTVYKEAGDEAHIEYGGNLYYLLGVRDYCSGAFGFEDMLLLTVDEPAHYVAPILAEGGIMIAAVVPSGEDGGITPASASGEQWTLMPLSVGDTRAVPLSRTIKTGYVPPGMTPASIHPCGKLNPLDKIDLKPGSDFRIENKVAVGKTAYVELAPTYDLETGGTSGKIIMFDLLTGENKGYMQGENLQASDTAAHFSSPVVGDKEGRNGIFKHDPKTDTISTATNLRIDGNYKVAPNGDIVSRVRDPQSGEIIEMHTTQMPGSKEYTYTMSKTKGNKAEENSLLKDISMRLSRGFTMVMGGSRYCFDRDLQVWYREDYKGGMPFRRDKEPDDIVEMTGWKIQMKRANLPQRDKTPDELADAFIPFCEPPVIPPPKPTPPPTGAQPSAPPPPSSAGRPVIIDVTIVNVEPWVGSFETLHVAITVRNDWDVPLDYMEVDIERVGGTITDPLIGNSQAMGTGLADNFRRFGTYFSFDESDVIEYDDYYFAIKPGGTITFPGSITIQSGSNGKALVWIRRYGSNYENRDIRINVKESDLIYYELSY